MSLATEEHLHVESGLKLAFKRWGNPQSPRKLLALHGWLDNAASFDALMLAMNLDYDMIALDLPGQGRSEHRHPLSSYHFVDWIGDVYEVVGALGWERFTLVGHSMGAAISLLTAGTFPDRVEALVAIEGLGPLADPAELAPETLAQGLSSRHIMRARLPRPMASFDEAIARMASARMPMTDEAMRAIASRGVHEQDGQWFFSHDPRLQGRSLLRLTEPQVLAFLGRISAPVLFIKSHEGWPVDDALISNRLGAIQSSSKTAQLPGGHHAHMEHPAQTAELITSFLRDP